MPRFLSVGRAPRQGVLLSVLLTVFLLAPVSAAAQPSFDASWYDTDQPHVKISVAEDGVYRVTGADLQQAGLPLSEIDPATLRLLENGRPIPLQYEGDEGDGVQPGDGLVFVGRRNRGTGELWAYEDNSPAFQSSSVRSLYTDTTHYFLTYGGAPSPRYALRDNGSGGTALLRVRDTLHLERDAAYNYPDGNDAGSPLYTRGEGYYMDVFRPRGADAAVRRPYALDLGRLDRTASAPVTLTAKLTGTSASCHRVALEADLGSGFEVLDEATWRGYAYATLQADVPAERVPPGDALDVRLSAYDTFEDDTCGDLPNNAALDFVEAVYSRPLAALPTAAGGFAQRFTAPDAARYRFALSGYEGAPVRVFSPADARRFELPAGQPAFTDQPSGPASYWAVSPDAIRTPVAVRNDAPSDWAAAANAADYVILTTAALRPSAEALAAYRRSHNGYRVAVVEVQDVFDQFDYGRRTPVAIRRFVYQTRAWSAAPRLLALWGDAAYTVRTETEETGAPWNVPTYGYAPSDAWYAMQYGGPNDFTEVLALGRVPIRTNAQGETFLSKLQAYEGAPLEDWQKRALLLSGGTSNSQQRRLQNYSFEWGDIAAARPTGADTLYFSKQTTDALDNTFQDSLSVAIERGAGWLNYFGHSAAQSWEVVTETPADFGNASRLPFVVSLGCRTGAFAGGRFDSKPAPSFGEQLVLGLDAQNPTGPGTANGAIAHFGTSFEGSISTSATLNDALIARVFQDTARVSGLALQRAKAEIADAFSRIGRYRDHLMQYNLLGDPAARLALPDAPDLQLAPAQIGVTPLTPVPSDSLRFAVRLNNFGLVPADSVGLTFAQTPPASPAPALEARRLPPFRLDTTVLFSAALSEGRVGTNRFRFAADPQGRIAEVNEANNAAEKTQIVFSSGLELLAPRPLAIARTARPTLRVTRAAADDAPPPALLELAADSAFSSVLDQARLGDPGLLLEWQPAPPLEDGHTYYWRARLDRPGQEADWRRASFTVDTGADADGWLQQSAQFSANTQQNLRRENEAWAFNRYRVNVRAFSERGSGGDPYGFTINGAEKFSYLKLGFSLLVLDGATGQPQANGDFATYDVPEQYEYLNDGVDDEAAIAALQTFLEDHVQEGDYVYLRTRHLANRGGPVISDEVKDLLRTLGHPEGQPYKTNPAIDTLTYRHVWTLKTRIGAPEETEEQVSPPEEAGDVNAIALTTDVMFPFAAGTTTTLPVGPARAWGRLDWEAALEGSDEVRVDVLTAAGDSVLIEGLAAGGRPHDLSSLDARQHPALRLRATLADTAARTAPQLERWRLTYTPTAEVALDAGRLAFSSDTLAEGQPLEVAMPVINLGDVPADTVAVRYVVTDAENAARIVARDTLYALAGGAETTTSATVETAGLAGANVLSVAAEQPGRPEPLTFNNALVKNFVVEGDRQAPGVRVTFDGRALPADFGEVVDLQDERYPFVSLAPRVEIEIEDDNPFQPVDRPELADLYLDCDPTDPANLGRCDTVPASDTTFTPGRAGEPARVVYTPDLAQAADSLRGGVHALYVDVRDASGNEAMPDGQELAYQVYVRTSSDLVVEDLYPYPNPMSTHTEFAFRLQGSTPAALEAFRIRIYTLAGRLIREFDLVDTPCAVNPDRGCGLQADWNRIPWDGTDADGHRVATGIYLYKVFAESADGEVQINGGGVEKIAVIR